jgi:hypothetical protein
MRNLFCISFLTRQTAHGLLVAILAACGTVVGNGKRPDDSDDAKKKQADTQSSMGTPENQPDAEEPSNSTSAGASFLPVSLNDFQKLFLPKLFISSCKPIFALRDREVIRRFAVDRVVMNDDAFALFHLKIDQDNVFVQTDWRTTTQAGNEYTLRYVWNLETKTGLQNALGEESVVIPSATCEDKVNTQQVQIASLNDGKTYFENRRILTYSDNSQITIAWFTNVAVQAEAEIEYVKIVSGNMQVVLKLLRDEQGQIVSE